MDGNSVFKNKKLNIEKLLTFGFLKKGDKYFYSADLVEGQFNLLITMSELGELVTDVVDAKSKESYSLHRVSSASGTFVGRIRFEVEEVLNEIANSCFDPDLFQSANAKRVIAYIKEKYQDELEFLWPKVSDNAIFRRKDNAKWYAALLVLSRRKLGFDSDEIIHILDIRMNPENVEMMVDERKYFPGYHMNKKHWVTICLDDSISDSEIFRLIDESHDIASKK